MTSLAHPAPLHGPKSGGVAARRAVVRWAWRMFRREWRQQILVTALLTLAVAAAIGSVSIAYNANAADDAEHGSASHLLRFDGSDPQALEAALDSARKSFGTIEVIGYRSFSVPGSVETVEFRAQEPGGPFGSELLAIRQGSYPMGPRQVAVTDGVAGLLALEIGETLALDGRRRTIVGIVENPRDLSDEFALVSPGSAGSPDNVTILVDTDIGSIDAFLGEAGNPDGALTGDGRSALSGVDDRPNDQSTSALAMFSVATVFLLLASLVAAAGFAVIAQRRLRQLGMLAAIGATQKHLRLVLLTNGAVVGAIGAVIGTVAGFAAWLALLPTLESAAEHRIDPLSLPWTLLAMVVLVAVLGAIAAAWWPGRTVARVPVTLALSARPPRPKPAHRSAIVAAVLIAAGFASLVLANRSSPPLIIAGIVATILGTLLLGPLAIRLVAAAAGRSPIAVRLALRDLARYQARSGSALAAITLALGIAATVVVVAAAEEGKSASEPPNLSTQQIRVHTGTSADPDLVAVRTAAELERMAVGVRRMAADLGDAAVIPLHEARNPNEQPANVDGVRVYHTEGLYRTIDDPDNPRWSKRAITCESKTVCWVLESRLYVATPALLRYIGIDPASVEPSTNFLADSSVETGELVVPVAKPERFEIGELPVTSVQQIDSRKLFGHPSGERGLGPASFITLDGLRRLGLRQVQSGWIVESSRPLTSEQVADARALAAENGLKIETRRESTSLARTKAIAIAAGGLLALAILAMTVGLIRSESAGDLRTLTATGATSMIRRTLTAATAGALALLGALLGVAGAYLALAAIYSDDLGYLGQIPVLPLALMVVGVPLTAAAAGWLLAGRQPPTIARPAIE
jgi:putative ABC transport system permease protein